MKTQLRHALRNPAEFIASLPWSYGIRVAKKKGNVGLANRVLRVMPPVDAARMLGETTFRWTTISFNTVLSRSTHWQDALRLFHLMSEQNVYTDATTYTAVLKQFSKTAPTAHWPHALNLLRQADSRKKVSLHTFNAAIAATRAHWPAAVEILQIMQKRDVTPDAVTNNMLLVPLERAKKDGASNMVPFEAKLKDNYTDAIRIRNLANSGSWEEATALLEQHPKSVWTYGAALKACATGNAWHKAVALLHQMRSEQIEPNSVCYNTVISACDRSHRPKEAWDVMSMMPSDLVNQKSINAMISANQRDWQVALVLFERLASPDTVSFNTLFHALGCKGMWQRALQMLPAVPNPDVTTYNTVMQHAISDGRPVMPIRRMLYKQMVQRGVSPSAASMVYAKREVREVVELCESLIARAENDPDALNELVILHDRLETLEGTDTVRAKACSTVANTVAASIKALQVDGSSITPDPILDAVPHVGNFCSAILRLLDVKYVADADWITYARKGVVAHISTLRNWAPPVQPQADSIFSWMQYDFGVQFRGAVVMPGEEKTDSDIRPIFAHHRRDGHSERRCLVRVDAMRPKSGLLRVYSSHTPCISCLACYWQFKRKYPTVTLEVAFDSYDQKQTIEHMKTWRRKPMQRENEKRRSKTRAVLESA